MAFQVACERLAPDAAFIAVHAGEGDIDRILPHEPKVSAGDADALIAERFGLLYLNGKLSQRASDLLYLDEEQSQPASDVYLHARDALVAGDGVLIFVGQGWGRWFGN